MGLEMIIGPVVAALAAIAGVLVWANHAVPTSLRQKRTSNALKNDAAATEAVAERRVETTKEPGMYSRLLIIFLMTMLTVSCAKIYP